MINSKQYNRETANELAKYRSLHKRRKFELNYYEETLYLNKSGEYFLYGFGLSNSKYSVLVSGNWWEHGDKLIPLTITEAKKWAKEHLDSTEYKTIFGEISMEELEELEDLEDAIAICPWRI